MAVDEHVTVVFMRQGEQFNPEPARPKRTAPKLLVGTPLFGRKLEIKVTIWSHFRLRFRRESLDAEAGVKAL
jgi:hypothetical protein